jgi:hypothetical protein
LIKGGKRFCGLLVKCCDPSLGSILGARSIPDRIKRIIQVLLGAAYIAFVGSEPRRREGNSSLRSRFCVDTATASIHVGVNGKSRESGSVLVETLASRFK